MLRHLLRDPYCLFDRCTEQDSDSCTEQDSDRCPEQDSEGLWVFRHPQSFTVMPV